MKFLDSFLKDEERSLFLEYFLKHGGTTKDCGAKVVSKSKFETLSEVAINRPAFSIIAILSLIDQDRVHSSMKYILSEYLVSSANSRMVPATSTLPIADIVTLAQSCLHTDEHSNLDAFKNSLAKMAFACYHYKYVCFGLSF